MNERINNRYARNQNLMEQRPTKRDGPHTTKTCNLNSYKLNTGRPSYIHGNNYRKNNSGLREKGSEKIRNGKKKLKRLIKK